MLEVSDQLFDTELCKEDNDDECVSANDVNLLQSNAVEVEDVRMCESIDNAIKTNNENCKLTEHVQCNSSEDEMTYNAEKTMEIMEMLLDPQLNIDDIDNNNTGIVAEVNSMNEKVKLSEEEEECKSCSNTNENIKSIVNVDKNTLLQTTSSLLTSSFTTTNTEHNLLTLLSTNVIPRTSESNEICAIIDNVLPELFNGLD